MPPPTAQAISSEPLISLRPATRLAPVLGLAAAVVMAVVIAVPAAHAADKTAEDYYEEGMGHYKKGKYLKAARSYVLAYDLADAPELAYNAARAFDKGGRWPDARRYYDRWLDGAPPLQERERLAERLAKAAKKAARKKKLDLAASRLGFARELLVTPDPDLTYRLARLYERADQRKRAAESYKLALDEGYGDVDAIEAALARLEGGPTPGRVVLVGDAREIRVSVDGKPVPGIETGKEFDLPVGKHKLIVDKRGHRPWRGVVEVRRGQLTTVPIQLAPAARKPVVVAKPAQPPRPGGGKKEGGMFAWPPPTSVWLAFGGGVAALSGGAIFGSLAAGAEKDLDACVTLDDRNCATSNVAQQLSDRSSSWETRANIAYGLALVGTGVGVWLWLSEPGGGVGDNDLDDLDDDLNAWIIPSDAGGIAGVGGRF